MTANKVFGLILLVLLSPALIGMMIFVAGWHIWEICWASGATVVDLSISLMVFIVSALSLSVATVWKGYYLIRSNDIVLRPKKMGLFLLIMGVLGILVSIVGLIEVYQYYVVPLLVSVMMILIGWALVYPLVLERWRVIASWLTFISLASATIYGLVLMIAFWPNWDYYRFGVEVQLYIGSWALYPWIITIEAWWLSLILKRRSTQSAIRQVYEPAEMSGKW